MIFPLGALDLALVLDADPLAYLRLDLGQLRAQHGAIGMDRDLLAVVAADGDDRVLAVCAFALADRDDLADQLLAGLGLPRLGEIAV